MAIDKIHTSGNMIENIEETRKFPKQTIAWEKWHDPFGDDGESNEEESYDDGYDTQIDKQSMQKPMKFLATPLGLFPLTEYTQPEKIFDFWVGHTTFSITPKIANIIEQVEGVEILNILTRYRFRMSCGKCYNPTDVRLAVANAVKTALNN